MHSKSLFSAHTKPLLLLVKPLAGKMTKGMVNQNQLSVTIRWTSTLRGHLGLCLERKGSFEMVRILKILTFCALANLVNSVLLQDVEFVTRNYITQTKNSLLSSSWTRTLISSKARGDFCLQKNFCLQRTKHWTLKALPWKMVSSAIIGQCAVTHSIRRKALYFVIYSLLVGFHNFQTRRTTRSAMRVLSVSPLR